MKTEIVVFEHIESDVIYYIGTNAKDNHCVIDKGTPDDLWFHVSTKSSCHITASVPGDIKRKDLKYIITQGAVLCKQHSYPSDKKLDILFTKIKYVQKTDVAGKVIISEGHSSIKTC